MSTKRDQDENEIPARVAGPPSPLKPVLSPVPKNGSIRNGNDIYLTLEGTNIESINKVVTNIKYKCSGYYNIGCEYMLLFTTRHR